MGRVQIIGSTIALGSSLVSGAWYIFYQPYFAARSGSRWTEVAQGVLIGTSRAVAEFGASCFIVLGQLVGVIGTGFRKVSYGRAPIERSLLRKPQTFTHAIVSGSAIVSASSRYAVHNFVSLPAKGWRDEGLTGAAIGLACGIGGLLLPVASIFDFTSRTMYGIGAEIEMMGSTGRWRAATRGPRRNHGQVTFCPPKLFIPHTPRPEVQGLCQEGAGCNLGRRCCFHKRVQCWACLGRTLETDPARARESESRGLGTKQEWKDIGPGTRASGVLPIARINQVIGQMDSQAGTHLVHHNRGIYSGDFLHRFSHVGKDQV